MRTIQRHIAAGFIVSSDNKLLMGHNAAGGVYEDCWVPPGGGVEDGETVLQALHREMLEEVGIDITNATIEPIKPDLTGKTEKTLRETGERVLVDMVFHSFIVTLRQTADQVTLIFEDDFADASWFAREQIAELKLSKPTTETLKLAGLLPS